MLSAARYPGTQASRAGRRLPHYDYWLLSAVFILLSIGLVMVASASITLADRAYGDPFYFFWRQSIAVLIGVGAALVILRLPLALWQKAGPWLMILGALGLVLVLVPGFGRMVNGSMRWIRFGPVSVQSSELVKIFLIVYLAGFLVRHGDEVRSTFKGFIRPILIVTMIAGLLLLEPDYGTAVVLFCTALGMLFMAGVPLGRFFAWMLVAIMCLVSLAVLSPYRLQRLTSFMDPWQDPFKTGFQLTQALIAFGRGEWLGVGLGSSVQKLFYLPEAHTDFVFAVMGEELGLAGCASVILLYFFLVWRAFVIAQVAAAHGKQFSAHIAYGVGLMIGLQAFINIGVNTGVLPTKGLALPLISYGGNSMVVNFVLLALLLRVEYENHFLRKDPAVQPAKKNYAT
ncbi:MAG TPA: putative lipid II flippase FtsW [Gammaproteobacteria bacterium]|nr:putative lipid II flippase FtsW [Gammaproteobacteria bacterium]